MKRDEGREGGASEERETDDKRERLWKEREEEGWVSMTKEESKKGKNK